MEDMNCWTFTRELLKDPQLSWEKSPAPDRIQTHSHLVVRCLMQAYNSRFKPSPQDQLISWHLSPHADIKEEATKHRRRLWAKSNVTFYLTQFFRQTFSRQAISSTIENILNPNKNSSKLDDQRKVPLRYSHRKDSRAAECQSVKRPLEKCHRCLRET